MRSLHAWILLCLAGTLLVALLVFLAISNRVQRVYLNPVFEGIDELELEQAVEALDRGGPAAVSTYMHHLDTLFAARHYLLTIAGIDVVSGSDLSNLLPRYPAAKSRASMNGKFVVTHRAPDGRYWFVAVNRAEGNAWALFPYYLLVIGITAAVYWLSVIGVLHPIQRIAGALDRFGHGNLSVRVDLNRKDEIGSLARSFDGMADRIQSLLASERRLLIDISHELRSPLTRLKFAVKLSQTERVQREVDRITSLVSEITELTRVEGDPPGRKLEVVDLQAVVDETVSDCQFEAEYRGCTIELRGQVSCLIKGDRELLRRAIENVLRNAIRYSPDQRAIECDLRDDVSGAAIIAVRDYGPGVPEDMLAQIFESFFRVEEARDAETGGTRSRLVYCQTSGSDTRRFHSCRKRLSGTTHHDNYPRRSYLIRPRSALTGASSEQTLRASRSRDKSTPGPATTHREPIPNPLISLSSISLLRVSAGRSIFERR